MIDEMHKRGSTKPIPKNLHQFMNPEQLQTYRGMQAYGWHLKFVRRTKLQRPLFVMTLPEQGGGGLAVIEEDGTFNKKRKIRLRGMEYGADRGLFAAY
jgi:hypothetical protein